MKTGGTKKKDMYDLKHLQKQRVEENGSGSNETGRELSLFAPFQYSEIEVNNVSELAIKKTKIQVKSVKSK